MPTLPLVFRKSPEVGYQVDYFDYTTGAGYKKFYLAGGANAAGNQYFLTSDAAINSHYDNLILTKTINDDVDFDLTFNTHTTIATAEAQACFTVYNPDNGKTLIVTINIYHVDKNGTETLIGTTTDATLTATPSESMKRRSFKISLTRKALNIGEKLRINIVLTGDADSTALVYIDPSGRSTGTEQTTNATINSSFWLNIPFEIDL